MKKHLYWLFLGFFFSSKAQEYRPADLLIDQHIQSIAPAANSDLSYEDLYQTWVLFYENPLELNSTDYEELASLHILSDYQIKSLLQHRQQYGKLLSIYELQAVDGFDVETIHKIAPFVQVDASPSLKDYFKHPTSHQLLMRGVQKIEQSKGYTLGDSVKNRYLGTPYYALIRYRRTATNRYSIGFSAEKDAGENFTKNGFDFYTFHAQLKNRGILKNIIIGDYQAQFGQGLVSAAGFFLGKSAESVSGIRRSDLGFRPYSSVVENGFFRGLAITFSYKSLDLSAFASFTKHDASLDADSLDRETAFRSILHSGYHRTPNEVNKKDNLGEQNYGLHLSKKFKNGQIGITGLYTEFDRNFERTVKPYNQFDFSGKNNVLAGIDGRYLWQNMSFFGELARSKSGGLGGVGGAMVALGRNLETSLAYRSYDRNFHSFYANGLGENTRNINEKGLYWGFKFKFSHKIYLNAFFDTFRFDWLQYQVPAPSRGYEYLFKLTYQPNKQVLCYATLQEKQKERGSLENSGILQEIFRKNLILNLEYKATQQLKLHSRMQGTSFAYGQQKPSTGYALMQDIIYKARNWQIAGRFAFFDTDDYDTRIYAFEQDVLGNVSFPFYYKKGTRTYLVLQRDINRKLDAWLRVARTSLINQKSYGSGLDLLNVPHQTEVKAQVRCKF